MDSICVDAVDRCTGNDHLPASPQVPSPHNDVSHTIILWLENDGAEVPYRPITRFDRGIAAESDSAWRNPLVLHSPPNSPEWRGVGRWRQSALLTPMSERR